MFDSTGKRHALFRRLAIGLAAAAVSFLAGCGGSGAADDAPAIAQFAADRSSYFVGERARLTAVYRGGAGRIEPGLGAVASGVSIETSILDRSVVYRLVVDGTGQTVARSLTLPVNYRDRYAALDTAFPSSGHAAVTSGDGAVLVIGGSRGLTTLSEAIDRFDPATRTFTRIGSLRTGRAGHTATRLSDGRILVLGGSTSLQIGNVADLVDERSGAVAHGGDLIQPRNWHAATLLADGRVLVTGGFGRDSAEIWDPATNTWRLVAARMAHMRWHHSATLLADGRVLIAGGQSASSAYQFAELFDPRTERFEPLASGVTEMRRLHVAHRLADGAVLILGGETFAADGAIVPLASVLRFDPAVNRFDDVAPLATARTLMCSVALPDGAIMLFGGETPDAQPSASAEAYRPALGGRAIAAMSDARILHTVTRLPDGRLLVLGGEGADGAYASRAQMYE